MDRSATGLDGSDHGLDSLDTELAELDNQWQFALVLHNEAEPSWLALHEVLIQGERIVNISAEPANFVVETTADLEKAKQTAIDGLERALQNAASQPILLYSAIESQMRQARTSDAATE